MDAVAAIEDAIIMQIILCHTTHNKWCVVHQQWNAVCQQWNAVDQQWNVVCQQWNAVVINLANVIDSYTLYQLKIERSRYYVWQ